MYQKKAHWKKVTYEDGDGKISVKQGYFFDEGDFVKLIGDYTEALIRREKIISVTSKRAGDRNERN